MREVVPRASRSRRGCTARARPGQSPHSPRCGCSADRVIAAAHAAGQRLQPRRELRLVRRSEARRRRLVAGRSRYQCTTSTRAAPAAQRRQRVHAPLDAYSRSVSASRSTPRTIGRSCSRRSGRRRRARGPIASTTPVTSGAPMQAVAAQVRVRARTRARARSVAPRRSAGRDRSWRGRRAEPQISRSSDRIGSAPSSRATRATTSPPILPRRTGRLPPAGDARATRACARQGRAGDHSLAPLRREVDSSIAPWAAVPGRARGSSGSRTGQLVQGAEAERPRVARDDRPASRSRSARGCGAVPGHRPRRRRCTAHGGRDDSRWPGSETPRSTRPTMRGSELHAGTARRALPGVGVTHRILLAECAQPGRSAPDPASRSVAPRVSARATFPRLGRAAPGSAFHARARVIATYITLPPRVLGGETFRAQAVVVQGR